MGETKSAQPLGLPSHGGGSRLVFRHCGTPFFGNLLQTLEFRFGAFALLCSFAWQLTHSLHKRRGGHESRPAVTEDAWFVGKVLADPTASLRAIPGVIRCTSMRGSSLGSNGEKKIVMLLTRMTWLCTCMLLLCLGNTYAQTHREVAAGDLVVINAWMPQPLQGAQTGVVYLKIENRGNDADQLVGAESQVAQELTLHESKESGGVMKMLPRNGVVIPGHGEVELKPMGIHLMAMGLKTVLKESDMFPITLKFERTGAITADVVVQAPNALKAHH
jgi:copper(I)-binding protein